jgi:HSP20 family protein
MPGFQFPSELPSFNDVRNEFDRLLDRVWHVGLNTAPLDGQDWAPAMDVIDEGERYRVRLEVPGLTGEQVEVSILNNTLVVRGTKAGPPRPTEGQRQLRGECRFGSFGRRYEFPSPVAEDGVTATCKLGVLDITITKRPEPKGRTIPVSVQD